MGKLDLACGYLSGPMEFVADHGVVWRRKFIKLAQEADLNLDFIDPTDKPGGKEIHIGENKETQATMQREGRWEELAAYVHAYRRFDLRFVDVSDFLIAVVDPTIPQWGTSNEVYVAEQQHKPMFFICDGGLGKLPRWLFDVIEFDNNRSNVYTSIEDVVQILSMLDNGELPLNDKWVLIRKNLESRRIRTQPLAT